MAGYRQWFESAVQAAVEGATVLTVNKRSAQAVRAAAEARLSQSHAAWHTPDVIPFGAFVERLWDDAILSGKTDLQCLNREQELQLWRSIIRRSSREMLLSDPAATLARNSYATAKLWRVPLRSAQMSATTETRAFAGWAADFDSQLASQHATVSASLIDELSSLLTTLKLPSRVFVFLYSIEPQRREFLDALARAGVSFDATEFLPAIDHGDAVRLEFDGVAEELESAAAWARAQLLEDPRAKVGVVVMDLRRKRLQVENIFRSVLQPEQLFGVASPTVFEIAEGNPLSEYPLVSAAITALSFAAGPVSFEQWSKLICSPYISADTADAKARFIAQCCDSARDLVTISDAVKWAASASDVPGLRGAFSALERMQDALSTERQISQWPAAVRSVLVAFGWPGPAKLGSSAFQCTERWRDLVADVASLDILGERCSFADFVNRLQRAADATSFKPQSVQAPVQIMDADESEGSVFDRLWIASASDDLWPQSYALSPLLPLSLLAERGAPVPGTNASLDQVNYHTARLLQCASHEVLSIARRSDDEREQRWSPLFASVPFGSHAPSFVDAIAASADMEVIFDDAAPPVTEDEVFRRGTQLLELQSNCPFRAFAERRLGAEQLSKPVHAIDPRHRGQVLDRALQLLWDELKGSSGLSRPDLNQVVADSVARAMHDVLPPAHDDWTIRYRELEFERSQKLIHEWLEIEHKRPQFQVVSSQHEIEMELAGMKFKGYADRVDSVQDQIVVIDYKATKGNYSCAHWTVPRPVRPQLPFYVAALQEKGENVGGATFALLRRGNPSFSEFMRDSKSMLNPYARKNSNFGGMSFDEYAAAWRPELERIVKSFVRGDASVDPKVPPEHNQSTCRMFHCHLQSLCRIGQKEEESIAPEGSNE